MKDLDAADGIQYFKQTADIDLSDQNWTPFEFGGHFDGNGKTISNVKIEMSTANLVGFFSELLTGGELTGIKLEKVNVKGRAWVGGLVGSADGRISNSYASGSVSGYFNYVGGLVGHANFNASISNSYASGNVTGFSDYVGGLVGYANFSASISNSYASSSVEGRDYVGGLVGFGSVTISGSYYDSQTTNQPDNGKGIPRTTDEMKQGVPTLSTVPRPIYVDWSTSIWDFGDATDYPTLRK